LISIAHITAHISWATTYHTASTDLIFPLIHIANVIAGLIWQPEMGHIAYTIVRTAKPKAREIPRYQTSHPAITAEPQPTNTNTKVPNHSAKYFFIFSQN